LSNSLVLNYSLLNDNKHRLNKWKNDPINWKKYKKFSNGSYSERQLLYRMPLELGRGNYADVGVLHGQSSACMIHGIIDSKQRSVLYSVDLFTKESKNTPEILLKYVKENNLNIDIKFCKGDSSEIGNGLNEIFNFVFIDADHCYRKCKHDWESWSKLVKIGGRIAFHDCHVLDVDKVINEINYNEWKFIDHIYSTKIFERIR